VKIEERTPVRAEVPARVDVHLEPPGTPGPLADPRTRDRVCRGVLEHGPVTATVLAGRMGLTPAAVRRHLDALAADGLVAVWQASQPRRGRGRPPRRYVVTDRGHTLMRSGYDDLASSALRFVQGTLGPQAVRTFAQQQAGELEDRYRPTVEAAGSDPARRAAALADALTVDGYAASVRPAASGMPGLGAQLCQGHCPVQHVAREFPELCEAETDAFSRLLGVHVQRLATLAHGAHVCTTHVPISPPAGHAPARQVPSASSTPYGRQSE
jgi:predicted ArsR family transcriptional regulator